MRRILLVTGWKDVFLISERPKGELLIAVFGGSAAFGHGNIRRNSFPFVLENKLNSNFPANKRYDRVKFINFAQEATLVLNQTISYMLFCNRIRLDIVISHDGYNDLLNGAIVDPILVSNTVSLTKSLQNIGQMISLCARFRMHSKCCRSASAKPCSHRC